MKVDPQISVVEEEVEAIADTPPEQLSPTTRWMNFNDKWQTQPMSEEDQKAMDAELKALLAIARENGETITHHPISIVTTEVKSTNANVPKANYLPEVQSLETDDAVNKLMEEMGY